MMSRMRALQVCTITMISSSATVHVCQLLQPDHIFQRSRITPHLCEGMRCAVGHSRLRCMPSRMAACSPWPWTGDTR